MNLDRPAVGSYRRTTGFRISLTDLDDTPMRTKTGAVLGYHDHYVVDGGKRRIIFAAVVTPADVMENVPCAACSGGSASDTSIVALEDAGIWAFFPRPDFDRRTP